MIDATINMSNTIAIESTAWYAQGPVFEAMEHAYPFVPLKYKVPYVVAKRVVKYLDIKLGQSLRKLSRIACANSYTMKRVYEGLGISIDCVIYEPLDTEFFQPKTGSPKGDYVLTYFGKETDYLAVKKVADKGVKIKAFGSKAASIVPKYVLNHPNIEVLGYVSDDELVELYSNALFTLFPFTEEPFGYVPVESMACGTPVLTYNRQGPSETVEHGVTGWLANSDKELVDLAVRIWKEGYPSWMRSRSREKALQFGVKTIADQWIETLKKTN
jgi:glycosyltransferase involved in cell wall biosynthesis